MLAQIQIRRDTYDNWLASSSIVLNEGEIGIEFPNSGSFVLGTTDTIRFKVGDGFHNWTTLPYFKIKLNELSDVQSASFSDKDILTYNYSTQRWESVQFNQFLRFIDLIDAPSNYTGSHGSILQVSGSQIIFIPSSSFVDSTVFNNWTASYSQSVYDTFESLSSSFDSTITNLSSSVDSTIINLSSSVSESLSHFSASAAIPFINLTDVPSSYVNSGSFFVMVNQAEDGLTFVPTNSIHSSIGTPDDGTYTDGFFDTWVSGTLISNAFDDINELLLDLLPAQPGVLTGTNLTSSGMTFFTGRVANGLNASDWNNIVPGTSKSNCIFGTSATFLSPYNATTFRAGKKSNFTPVNVLLGGVTGSLIHGVSTLLNEDSRSLDSGTGVTGILNVNSLAIYNSIWVKANATITETLSVTGSNRFTLAADNGAGVTNEYETLYVGTLTEFPNQSFSITPYTSSETPYYKYLSGIPYYGYGTQFNLYYRGQDLFNPVYYNDVSNLTQITSYGTGGPFFTALGVGPGSPPLHYDLFTVSQAIVLLSNKSSTINNKGQCYVTLNKAGKTAVNSSYINLGDKGICTYGTHATNGSSTWIEYFHDEYYRMDDETIITPGAFLSSASLSNGDLQVRNGRLVHPNTGDYSGFTGDQDYYRIFTPTGPKANGTITIDRDGFASFVEPWGGSGALQAAFYIYGDTNIYDLGRAVGDDTGIIKGIRNGSPSGELINWSLPAGKYATPSNPFILIIRFTVENISNWINTITVTWV